MKETFNLDWLRMIPRNIYRVPEEYDLGNFVNWEKKYNIDESNLISSSKDMFGKVYDVGEGLVAKVFKEGIFLKNGTIFNNHEIPSITPYLLEREFWMGRELEKTKMNTPHSEGLALVYNEVVDEYRPAFIIEKINSVNYDFLNVQEMNAVNLLRDKEFDLAREGGVVPGWDSKKLGNYLLSKEDGKVYPIDYMHWYKI